MARFINNVILYTWRSVKIISSGPRFETGVWKLQAEGAMNFRWNRL